MIALARSVYQPTASSPQELLELPSAAAVEDKLLARFLRTVYPSTAHAARAVRWLSLLAHHLEDRLKTPNLAWWQLARAVPRIVIATVVTLILAAAGGLASAIGRPFTGEFDPDVLFGAALGLAVGVVAGLNAARSVLPQPITRSRWGVVLAVAAAALRDGLAAACALTVAMSAIWYWETGAGLDLLTLLEISVFGGILGIGLGVITNGLRVWRGSVPNRPSARVRQLLPRMAAGIGIGLLLAVPFGISVGLITAIEWWNAGEGLETGLWTILALGGALGVPIGIGRWLSSPVDDQDPLSPVRCSAATGSRCWSLRRSN
jgi:hypothetical protein